jgi:SAM-dependent methyltransferase
MSRQGKLRENVLSNVKDFWKKEAEEFGETPIATIRDICFRNLEILFYKGILPPRNRMLDVGCGNGHGTINLHATGSKTVGIDYVPELISIAKSYAFEPMIQKKISEALFQLSPPDIREIQEAVTFYCCDILKLELKDRFDLIVGQRLLINLVTHENQMIALQNLRRTCDAGSLLYLTEASEEGHARTDNLRSFFGLAPLEKYWHNFYVKEHLFPEWKMVGWKVAEVLHFDSYFLISKVIYPAAVGEANCEFLSPANRAALLISGRYRTYFAAQEIGLNHLLWRYLDIVSKIDHEKRELELLKTWIAKNIGELEDWSNMGHQKIIVAEAI